MKVERIEAGEDAPILAERLRQLIPNAQTVSETVAEIIAQVRSHGDAAVRDYTRRFDTGGMEPPALIASTADLQGAARMLAANVRSGL